MFYMKDLEDKLVVQLGLRIEQVRRFEVSVPTDICPKDFFCEDSLATLFQENALVLPFVDSNVPFSLMYSLHSVLDHFLMNG